MLPILFGIVGLFLYGALGLVVATGLGRLLMPVQDRKRIAQRTASAGLWVQFGSMWAFWPLALGLAIVGGIVVGGAKMIGHSASYMFDALESSE